MPLDQERSHAGVCVYWPNSTTECPAFLESLGGVVDSDLIARLGDFNTHVGNNSDTWSGMIVRNGINRQLSWSGPCFPPPLSMQQLGAVNSKSLKVWHLWYQLWQQALNTLNTAACSTVRLINVFFHGALSQLL